ncbi:MAG TPA: family 16 glycoside hydrolase [Verrucomicrobiae bacterium]|jgi:hypothetical protein|nr:family 16 glycoside hydrolase [Verrucomicrobiae bacterium]
MKSRSLLAAMVSVSLASASVPAQQTIIDIDASHTLHTVSPYLTGSCLEDVNHEVYGGIYSQMIFGESFAEPSPQVPIKDFKVFGRWTPEPGGVHVIGGEGSKLAAESPAFTEGEASVEFKFNDDGSGNAGMIVKVSNAGKGHDQFDGYEISLEPSGHLLFGRHRQNWEPIRTLPCEVQLNAWMKLTVSMTADSLKIFLNDKLITEYTDTEHPLEKGTVGLRTWQRDTSYRHFTVKTGGETTSYAFNPVSTSKEQGGVSEMWRPLHSGSANGSFAFVENNPFSGHQSQQITFANGSGEIGIENRGLNHWGMNFVRGKRYEGYVYVRAQKPTSFFVSLENGTASQVYSQKRLKVAGGEWQRVEFSLTPDQNDTAGGFSLKLKEPGSITVGYVFLQPGEWGRFKGLPVRKDVGQGLVDEGNSVLRFGGGMANAAGYRWKKMIGPREKRAPYLGSWYPYSSLGWGVFEFLDYCEAAGILGVPDINVNETSQDMADFVDYVNGPSSTEWGAKRAAGGHSKSYHLKFIELGNEERVDEHYFEKFKPIAEAIWAKDPRIILIVGDFVYDDAIQDPFNFTGAGTRITSMSAHQKILQLAKAHNAEVWFDVHVGTEGPRPSFGGFFSYADALDKIADGARHHLLTFEFNAGNHSLRRGLANAAGIMRIERDGRIPISTSANCLQPDGENDNDWDQGLLFLNPSRIWLQPPGYVMQMIARNYEPTLVECSPRGGDDIECCATRSADGKTLVLQVVNYSDHALPATLQLNGYLPGQAVARVNELSGSLQEMNTAIAPERIKSYSFDWPHNLKNGRTIYILPPLSFSIIKFQ